MKRTCRKIDGFTLVELLVVIAVISTLAALLLPVLHRSIASARQVACANNQKQIFLGTVLYADQWKVMHPPSHDYLPDAPGGYVYWNGALKTMKLVSLDATYCPIKMRFIGQKARAYQGYHSDYGLSKYMFLNGFTKMTAIKSPTKLYMYGEKEKYWVDSYERWQIWYSTEFSTDAQSLDEEAHGDGLNILFADGHSEHVNGAAAGVRDYAYLPWYNKKEYKP